MLPPIYIFIFGCKVDGQWFFHFFESGTKLKTLSEIQWSFFPSFFLKNELTKNVKSKKGMFQREMVLQILLISTTLI